MGDCRQEGTKTIFHKLSVGVRRNVVTILVFLLVCIVEGAIFLHSTGPLTIPDSDLHANAAYVLATGQEFTHAEKRADPWNNPVKIQEVTGDSRYLSRYGASNGAVSYLLENFRNDARTADASQTGRFSKILYDRNRAVQESVNEMPKKTMSVPAHHLGTGNRSNQYFPIVYLPQACGVWLGLKLGTPPFTTWQLGRIANFLVFLVLFSLAIALLPRGKYFLAVLGVLPGTVFLATSLMADGLYISVAALFVALFLRTVERDKPINNRVLAVFVILTALLLFSKGVYVALALLLMVLPANVLSTKRKVWFVVISMLVTLPIYGIWSVLFGSSFPTVNVAANTEYAGKHPFKIVVMVLLSTLQFLSKHFPTQFFGILALVAVLVAWVVFIVINRSAIKKEKKESWVSAYRYVLMSVVIVLLIVLAIDTFEALIWNQLSTMSWKDYIYGLEERYLWPLMPLLLTIGYTHKNRHLSTKILS
ncbi:DUF2142 domain-containing protein [Bifidobacterium sp. ESL0790]|uniref:DUF2142 domain-containing protein n=1 Tax=Bifidobacterium sp. ESL0790 TaxID=2983233 RepID=UPI0023F85B70|nr:DUF2142 domain-containing protein [Bifidobacterium sp. ESL0790]WEV72335.1 DUF2142 domain-containing protein [Bifidobacterium sp. ESL0790]